MPLEVRELLIRALVDPSKSGRGQSGGTASSTSSGSSDSTSSWESQRALLDQFHKMLKMKKER